MKIFVDMDGVLCNFEKKAAETLGVPLTKKIDYDDEKTWEKINAEGSKFWSTMEWLPDGKELWDFVKDLNTTILSSPPKEESCSKGKREWIKKNLGDVPVILDSEKYLYAVPGAVLIDDLAKNIDPWQDHKGIGILHKGTASTLNFLKKLLADEKRGNLPEQVDKIADILERKGLIKEAHDLDVIANTLEALDLFRNKPVVLDPYDAIVQEAVRSLGPVLKNVDVIKLETSCSGNKLAWVSNQDLIKGAPGKQRVIHLCLNKIKENFKEKYKNTFTLSDPSEQKQMKGIIVQFLKDVVLPHEAEHIRQEMEHGGEFGSGSEQKAERAENWKAVEEMGFKKK